jgi:cytochrome P450
MEPFVYDPARPDFQANAATIYRELRDRHPVYHNREAGFWALSRFDDVFWAAGEHAALSSENTDITQEGLPQIQQLDPPRHDALRRLAQVAFTPRRVRELEPRIREIARELIRGFAHKGEADLLLDFARHLPSRVIGEMIGVPAERNDQLLAWTEAMVAVPQGVTQAENVRAPALEIAAEFARLLEERRRTRRDDLMSALLDARIDGQSLTPEELLGFCFVLVVAGNDTTTNLIANGALLLARHPDQRRALARDPGLLPAAIEEMLRLETPAHALPRRALRDVERHGAIIPRGALVRLVFAAANLDEREFPDPLRCDIRRPIRRHLAFGQGVHFCLGAQLARAEARIAFEELLARIPEYEVQGEPHWQTSVWARALERLPVRFAPV